MRKILDKIYLEITNTCNLNCSFCLPTNRTPLFMNTEKFASVLQKIKGKSKVVYFHLMGEPLLHPELGTFLDLCAEEKIPVRITTNGSLLEHRLPELVYKPALKRLNISLQSLGQFSKSRLHTELKIILTAAVALHAANTLDQQQKEPHKKDPFRISLRLWTSDDTGTTNLIMEGIEDFFALAPQSVATALHSKNGLIIKEGIAIHKALTFDWPDFSAPEIQNRGFCYALRDQAGILVDGTVVPCCLDRNGNIALGNIFETDWDTIMQSPRARALYDGFTARTAVEKLCNHCTYRKRFGDISKN